MIEIVRLERPDKTWDRFVEQHPAATVAHLGAWGPVISGAYGHEVTFLAARDGEDMLGGLPLVLFRSPLFGRRLVSMPDRKSVV